MNQNHVRSIADTSAARIAASTGALDLHRPATRVSPAMGTGSERSDQPERSGSSEMGRATTTKTPAGKDQSDAAENARTADAAMEHAAAEDDAVENVENETAGNGSKFTAAMRLAPNPIAANSAAADNAAANNAAAESPNTTSRPKSSRPTKSRSTESTPVGAIQSRVALSLGRRQAVLDLQTSAPLVVVDLLASTAAAIICVFVASLTGGDLHASFAIGVVVLTIGFQSLHGLYPACGLTYSVEFRRITRTSLMVLAAAGFGLALTTDSLICITATWSTLAISLTTFLLVLRPMTRRNLRQFDWWAQPVIVIGGDDRATELHDRLTALRHEGVRAAGIVFDHNSHWADHAGSDPVGDRNSPGHPNGIQPANNRASLGNNARYEIHHHTIGPSNGQPSRQPSGPSNGQSSGASDGHNTGKIHSLGPTGSLTSRRPAAGASPDGHADHDAVKLADWGDSNGHLQPCQILGPIADLESILSATGICRIAVTDRRKDNEPNFGRYQGIPHVMLPTDFGDHPSERVRLAESNGKIELHCRTSVTSPHALFAKRALDLTLIFLAAPLWLPMMLVIAASLKWTDTGPIFYRQRRVGRFRRPIYALKFRSMVVDADKKLRRHLDENPAAQTEWDATHKLKNDPRVTKIGEFLRKTSLDELPQLFNVIRGDMSLVGPRPIIDCSDYDREYIQEHADVFEMYMMVRPGITGMWQVSGRNGTSYKQRVYFDRFYLHNWSLMMDVYILWRTIKTALFREGAC